MFLWHRQFASVKVFVQGIVPGIIPKPLPVAYHLEWLTVKNDARPELPFTKLSVILLQEQIRVDSISKAAHMEIQNSSYIPAIAHEVVSSLPVPNKEQTRPDFGSLSYYSDLDFGRPIFEFIH